MNSEYLTFTGDLYGTKPFDGSALGSRNLVINFEGAVTENSEPAEGKVNLSMSNYPLKLLFNTTPLAANLANNHIMDFGGEGLERTKQYLKDQNVLCWGAGRLEENVGNPLIMEFNSLRIGLIGYVKIDVPPNYATVSKPGVRFPSHEVIKQDIEKCKRENADRMVVSLHWGVEEVYLPKSEDVELAHFIIDSGADMIIGHHSHCIQPWEIYQGKYIFYGLGNLFFSDMDTPAFFTKDGMPQRIYKKKQKYWNKESLLVHYNPSNESVLIQKAAFSKSQLSLKGYIKRKYRLRTFPSSLYKTRFQLSYLYGKARKVLFSLIENPRMLFKLKTYTHYFQMWKTYGLKA